MADPRREAMACSPRQRILAWVLLCLRWHRLSDVLVLFDYRRYEQDKVTMAQLALEQGAKVILFTDRWLSPVSAHAEVVLPSLVTTPSPYDSFVPTLAVVETVVAGVVTALGDDAPARLRHTEETARRLGLQ